jgi:tetratricopeptide (TPR) repeat protein
MGEGRWDVFVSYGHEDAAWVGALADNLHRDGFDVFLDEWELVGGDRVTGRLEDAIRRSLNGVLVVSPHSLSRPWVREEYEALLRQAVEDPSRRLIPVLYRDAELPAFMANRLWVDFRAASTGPGYSEALERLERYLQGKAARDRPQRGEASVWPAGAGGEFVRPAGSMRLSLVIEPDRVSLRTTAEEHSQPCAGPRPATVEAVKNLHWLWRRGPSASDDAQLDGGFDGVLADVGRRLSADFLAGDVGAALAEVVADAARLNEVIEVGIQTPEREPGLSELPWETLVLPDPGGTVAAAGATALALHRNVALYREVGGLGAVAAYKVRGPLRVLVAIASPESQNEAGELLNYEAELARIVAVVDPARRGADAHVRVLSEGSLAAIRSALSSEPEGFHVLHVSCHARPGELILETADGEQDPVSARRLLAEGLPAGVDLPMVVLSGCSTGLGARAERLNDDDAGQEEGELALSGVARQLLGAGVPVVLAMQSPVTDSYAAELTATLYGQLASAEVPDALVALSEARRRVEQARQALPADAPRRARAEWATPALWVRGLRIPLFNRHEPFGTVAQVSAPVLAEGIVVRKVGEFVGRRQQLRLARRALAGAKAGLVIHGLGGIGKSTLAAEVITSAGAQHAVVSLRGALSVDGILDELGARLHMLLPADQEDLRTRAQQLRAGDIEWSDRWRALSELILPAIPILVLLDNFEDNLQRDDAAWRVRDLELADLLRGWVRRPGQSKLLVTSRYPFELPDGAHRRLQRLHLGPLSAAETAKLVWQLPGLDALPPAQRLRAYRDVGGHPRTLEYLDALLQGGRARFDDVAERMEQRLSERGIDDPDAWLATHARDADGALAEAVTLAVDDVVLGDLLDALARTPLARELVIGASVYRVPVEDTALVWQLADETMPAPDPARDARIARIHAATAEARKTIPPERLTPADLGLSDDEIAAYQTDVQDLQRRPVAEPDGFAQALSTAAATGLIAPIARADDDRRHLVHRWTARAIAQLHPDRVAEAHHRAARYWRWRVAHVPQTARDDLEQLLEARSHHHAAGEHNAALELSLHAFLKLRTWGQYGRASELCRETLQWVPDGSAEAAEYTHLLGILAQDRGDYEIAEQRYTQALEIKERLGGEAGLAAGYHQLGTLAQARGDYKTAEQRYTQALEIHERLGDQAGLGNGYYQLGILAQFRRDYETAEQRYMQALEINERLDDQAGIASSYHVLGMLTQDRGDYETAEQRYTQALEIFERLGDQAGLAVGYHQLGRLAQDRGHHETADGRLAQARGHYETAEQRYTQALELDGRLGNQAGLARGYHQLGIVAQARGDYEIAEPRYTQALEINERLGNEAGLASSYGQLGILAQDRGDDETAEQRYTQSLQINERLGDQAGLDTNYRALAALMNERRDDVQAVGYELRGLSIRIQMGDGPAAASCVRRLAAARSRLGHAAFNEVTSQLLDQALLSLQALDGLLDQYAASNDDPDDGTAANAS